VGTSSNYDARLDVTITCQQCGEAEATVHVARRVTKFIGATKKEECHLCDECAEADLGFSKSEQARLKEVLKAFVMKPKLDEGQDEEN